ncbi:MAG: hypothetical protein ABR511_11005 [Acidimicrobiales bacterium]
MSTNWLMDVDNPLLSEAAMARVDDVGRPDRLAWNTFQTLALWDTDAWVPRLVDVACGDASPLAAAEWAGGTVRPWATALDLEDAADVVLEGPEAVLVVVATLRTDPPVEELRAGVLEALADSLHPEKQAGFVVVVPPGAPDLDPWLDVAADFELRDHHLAAELVPGATGWLTWRELGELALDLAEEADELRGEAVHRLAGELQAQFPDVEL